MRVGKLAQVSEVVEVVAVEARGRQVGHGAAEQGAAMGGVFGGLHVATNHVRCRNAVDVQEDQQFGAALDGRLGALIARRGHGYPRRPRAERHQRDALAARTHRSRCVLVVDGYDDVHVGANVTAAQGFQLIGQMRRPTPYRGDHRGLHDVAPIQLRSTLRRCAQILVVLVSSPRP